jgi:hypothetical protein
VSPDDPLLHTNSVESIWCSAKVHFKMMRGVKRAFLQSYLDEYSYRRNNDLTKIGAFEAILTSIADQYLVSDFLEMEKLSLDENEGMEIDDVNEDVGHAKNCDEPLIDGDIDELVYPTDASFETLGSTSGSETTQVTEESITQVTEENEATESEVNEPEAKKPARSYSFLVSANDFEHMLENAFNKLENGEVESFKFPGTLSKEQREIIHQRGAEKGIFTESSGTFPRCVTIAKMPLSANTTTSRGQVRSQIVKESNLEIPNHQHVQEVISQVIEGEWTCENCGQICKSAQGLKVHIAAKHKKNKSK